MDAALRKVFQKNPVAHKSPAETNPANTEAEMIASTDDEIPMPRLADQLFFHLFFRAYIQTGEQPRTASPRSRPRARLWIALRGCLERGEPRFPPVTLFYTSDAADAMPCGVRLSPPPPSQII